MHLLQAGVNLICRRLSGTLFYSTEVYARTGAKQKREVIEKASEILTLSGTVGEW